MANSILRKIFIFPLILLMIGCETVIENQPEISGKVINYSDCKSLKSGENISDISDSLSCVNYVYNQNDKKLLLTHINSGFNCCPENIYCSVSIKNDTITVQEYEAAALCDCNCLYDLDIEIDGIINKEYHIKFVEPYVYNQEEIIFSIDIEANNEGSYCVTRKQYPWGMK